MGPSRGSILLRYKYINGTEGNSINRLVQGVQSAITWEPDVGIWIETSSSISRKERYLRYKVLSAFALRAGSEWVVAEEKSVKRAMKGG